MKRKRWLCMLFSCLMLLSACDDSGNNDNDDYPTAYEASPKRTISELLLAESPEINVVEDQNHRICIDYSNAHLGYIRIKRLLNDERRIKLKILKGDEGNAGWYDLNQVGVYETFPLVNGSGMYTIRMGLESLEKDGYYISVPAEFNVQLENELTPFLYPNQTVEYDESSETIKKAFELCAKDDTDLQRVKTIYEYVVSNISYDYDKIERIKNNYTLPDLDGTITSGKGICFDYAGVMAAMCRSQHIPCRVVTGDTEIETHAWVEVWLEGIGWINPEIEFKGKSWTHMDPTFTSTKANYKGEYIAHNYY